MKIRVREKSLVEVLRELAERYKSEEVLLPVELARVISGVGEEKGWQVLGIGAVLGYIADMLER